MSTNNNKEKPFTFRFLDTKPRMLLELQNTSENAFRSIAILTIFLKDEETPDGGPSQAHIRFDAIKSMRPKDSAVVSHRTWINGKPVNDERDQMARLKAVTGETNPYVLDLSWENGRQSAFSKDTGRALIKDSDSDGKQRFQYAPTAFIIGDADGYSLIGENRSFNRAETEKRCLMPLAANAHVSPRIRKK